MNRLWHHWQQANPAQLWLLAGLTLVLVPHLTRLPPLIILPTLGLLLWRLLYELKLAAMPSRLLRWLLTLAALLAVYFSFQGLFGRQAAVGLLVVMLGLKLTEMRDQRDVTVVAGLGYFVVVTVFMFSQSVFVGIYMVLVVTLLTSALTAVSRNRQPPAQTHNLRLAARLQAQAAPLALLLFVLFPRVPGPLWNLPNDSFAATTGLAETMAPGEISLLTDDDSVAFRVQFAGDLPQPPQRYWRGPVLTYFDGKTWGHPDFDPERGTSRPPRLPSPYPTAPFEARGPAVNYQLTLEPHQRYWLFALDLPAALPPDSWLTRDQEIIARNPVSQLTQYALASYPDYVLGADQLPNRFRYLQLPRGAGREAQRLAQGFVRQATSPADVVELTLDYFRMNDFWYTRQPPAMLSDPVDQFLFDTRRGYCEHYASSFVFLMRAAGIPARVVTGYQGGEANPLGDYFIVRQSDAHAWAEVWLQERGWVRVDPTAVIPPQRVENLSDRVRIAPELGLDIAGAAWSTQLWQRLAYGWDNLNHYWNQWVINYNQATQMGFLKWLGLEGINWRGMAGLLLATVALVVGALSLRLLRPTTVKPEAAVLAYRRFCRKLARRGVVRRPAEGTQDFCARAAAQLPRQRAGIEHISALYQELRYGAQPAPDALHRLETAVRRFHP